MLPFQDWRVYTVVALILYGVWGLISKIATNYIDPKTVLFYDIGGAVAVGIVLSLSTGINWSSDLRGIGWGLLTGIVGTTATYCFFVAVSQGSSSLVLPLTSLYPAVTVILAFVILREPIHLRQALGIILAIIAIILCTGEK